MVWLALSLLGCSLMAEKGKGEVPKPGATEDREQAAPGRGRRGGEKGRTPQSAPGDGARGRTVPGLVEVKVSGDDIGGERSAWVHVPADRPKDVPVVLAFHGGTGRDGTDMAPNWKEVLDEPILFVFPNGKALENGEPGWTGYGREAEGDDPLRDIRFVKALLHQLDDTYGIDRTRVYAAGFSNGGYMTWHLACLAPEDFAGVAILSKPFLTDLEGRCAPKKALPLVFFQGTDDPHAKWEGKQRSLSAPDTIARWTKQLGCTDPKEQTLPDSGDATTVVRSTWTCERAAFEFFKVEGGGHFWPRKQQAGPPGLSRDVEASEEILRFWREHAGL